MKIEIKEKGTPAFYKEIVCALAQYMPIMKKPERKLKDSFKMLKMYIGVCGAFLVLVTALGIFYGMDALTILSIVVLLAAIILSMMQLNRLDQLYRSLQEDTHLSILTLDEEGVELNKEASQLVRMAWNNVVFLRVFDESLCFFGKDARGMVIAVNRNHEKHILDYISDNGIDVKIIGN